MKQCEEIRSRDGRKNRRERRREGQKIKLMILKFKNNLHERIAGDSAKDNDDRSLES